MATVRDENGVERFVLCDLSAPSQWVSAKPTNGTPTEAQAPEGNEAAVDGLPTTETATDLLVDCMQAMKRQMDTMTERMEAMQADQARQLELQEVDLRIALAEQHEAECESELKRQKAKRDKATAQLQDLRRCARDLRSPQVSTGEDLIARRVRVWWTAEREFYDGTVTDQRAVQNGGQELFIEYDDGDKMWHSTNETRIVEIATEDAPEVSPSARSEHAPQLND